MRATSSATLPLPITAAAATSSGGVEVGEFGMAVIPADEGGRADHAGQVVAGNVERPVVGRAGGEDHRVVEVEQLGDGDVAADQHVADEADIVAERDLLVALVDRLDRLVVGRDAEADQAVGHRHPVDHVDPDLVAIVLLERLGAVIAGGPRPDHRDMPHPASSVSPDASAPAARQGGGQAGSARQSVD